MCVCAHEQILMSYWGNYGIDSNFGFVCAIIFTLGSLQELRITTETKTPHTSENILFLSMAWFFIWK